MELPMQQIATGLYTFTGLLAGRVYLMDRLTLIDTSIASAGSKIISQLAAVGHSVRDVKRILITHAHSDHVGALSMLKQESDAEVIISEIERPVLEGEKPVPRPAAESLSGLARWLKFSEDVFKGLQPDRILTNGEVLSEVMGGLQAIATPGHAPGHLSFGNLSDASYFVAILFFAFSPAPCGCLSPCLPLIWLKTSAQFKNWRL
jgi:glyoxylase-like metal-dependent hydrolase (beta-lactamase superfamily II)